MCKPCACGLASAWGPLKQNRSGLVVAGMPPCALGYVLIHFRVQQCQQHGVLNLLLLVSIACMSQQLLRWTHQEGKEEEEEEEEDSKEQHRKEGRLKF